MLLLAKGLKSPGSLGFVTTNNIHAFTVITGSLGNVTAKSIDEFTVITFRE